MILVGLADAEKREVIADIAGGRSAYRVAGEGAAHPVGEREITYKESIEYRHFYRWLREIDKDSLLIVDEPLHGTDRSSLNLNCIRHYAAQAGQTVVFSRFPIVESEADFCILFDLATKSRWRRTGFSDLPLEEVDIIVRGESPSFSAREVGIDAATARSVERTKQRLFANIGAKHPDTIPRTLYLATGKARRGAINPGELVVGRNRRLPIDGFATYRDADKESRTVFEFCHSRLDMIRWLHRTGQTRVEAIVADAKVDRFYFERFRSWSEEVSRVRAAIHQ